VSSKLLNMKKQSKWWKRPLTLCLFLPPLFKKLGGKTINKIGIKKALAKSVVIFMPKRSGLLSQGWFLKRDDSRVYAADSVQDFKRRQRFKDDPLTALFARNCPSGLGLESERDVGAGGHVVVPGEHQDKLGWGSWNCRQKWVHDHYSEVDGLLRKVHLNQQGLGLKKFWYIGVFKMISKKDILPWAFVSDHTSYITN
jgi:hypothetical protein